MKFNIIINCIAFKALVFNLTRNILPYLIYDYTERFVTINIPQILSSCRRIILEKLILVQLVNQFPGFFGNMLQESRPSVSELGSWQMNGCYSLDFEVDSD
jgi:hypothetical protein